MKECLNCIDFLPYIKKIDKQIPTFIVFQKKYERTGPKILESLSLRDWKNEQVIYSDSVYDAISRKGGDILLLDNKNEVRYKAGLRSITKAIADINIFGKLHSKPLLPDSIILSDRTAIEYAYNQFFIADELFNAIYIVRDTGFFMLTYKDFDVKDLYEFHHGDTSLWYEKRVKYQETLANTNSMKPKLMSVFPISNKKWALNIAFATLKFNEENQELSTLHYITLYVYENNKILARYKNNFEFGENKQNYYGYNKQRVLFDSESSFYAQVYAKKPTTDAHSLGHFKVKNQEVTLEKLLGNYPKEFEQNNSDYFYAFNQFVGDFMLYQTLDEVLNLTTGEVSKLPISSQNNQLTRDAPPVIDFIVVTGSKFSFGYQALIKKSEQYFLCTFNEKFEEERIIEVVLPQDVKKLDSFILYQPNTVAYLDTDNNLITFKVGSE
ncbi:MAG: hypothetical protein JJT94_02825 [Bernardetiaceae bacterium]|nr:hypothetical protein [Bernardetiaceae bacterium]